MPSDLAANDDRPPPFEPMRLRDLYLFCLASFGVYSLIWIFRAGRASNELRGSGPHPFLWLLGTSVPLIGSVALHRLGKRAREAARRRGAAVRGEFSPVAGILFAAISVIGALPAGFMTAFLLLYPIPFLIVQNEFNRPWGDARTWPARQNKVPTPLRWSAVAIGIVAWLGIGWLADRYLVAAWLGDRLATGETVVSERGGYSLTAENARFSRVGQGTIGDEDSDLEFHSLLGDAWIVAYAHGASGQSIDSIVDERRSVLREIGAVRREEFRRFLDAAYLDLVSLAYYEVPGAFASSYVVATATIDDRLVEVVGYAGDRRLLDDVRRFVQSLRSHRIER